MVESSLIPRPENEAKKGVGTRQSRYHLLLYVGIILHELLALIQLWYQRFDGALFPGLPACSLCFCILQVIKTRSRESWGHFCFFWFSNGPEQWSQKYVRYMASLQPLAGWGNKARNHHQTVCGCHVTRQLSVIVTYYCTSLLGVAESIQ